jgi:hypothetical protein
MQIRRITINHDNLQQLGEIAVEYMGKNYISVTDEMIVIGTESFAWRTSSAQWNMVVLKRKGRNTQIDILGTAGGTGFFNFNWGSESSFTKKLIRHFKNYCEVNNWQLEELVQ